MFTGIIEELGSIYSISRIGSITRIAVGGNKVLEDVKIGDSIAVNGVCLTIVKKAADNLSFEVMPQTLKETNLGFLKLKDKVNLERSLKLGDRVSGHFVSGHIDCIGVIRKKTFLNNNLCFEIAIPQKFIKYCILKGSVAVDGISLTVAQVKSSSFCVFIIPHTLKNTTLSFKGPSSGVNIEFDHHLYIIAK